MDLLGNFWWWMASWQHGLSRGLGFCSYRPLFIPRCQSLYGNQLVNPSSPFLPLFPPSLSPQSSLLSLSWCKGSLPTTEGELSWPRSETGGLARLAVGEEVSAAPLEALSAALAMYRFQLFCPSWITGPTWIGRTFKKPCQVRERGEKIYLLWLRVGITVILGLKFFRNQFSYLASPLVIKRKTSVCVCVYVCVLLVNVVNLMDCQIPCNGWCDDQEEKCVLLNFFHIFFLTVSVVCAHHRKLGKRREYKSTLTNI